MKSWTKYYSGTSLDNFIKCAVGDTNKKIFFDKSKELKHTHTETFYSRNINTAAVFALNLGRHHLHHTPVILEILLEDDNKESYFSKNPLEVGKIYKLNPKSDWKNMNPYKDNIWDYFFELNLKNALQK